MSYIKPFILWRQAVIYGNTYHSSWRTCRSWKTRAPLGTRRTLRRANTDLLFNSSLDSWLTVNCWWNSFTWTPTPGSPWLPCSKTHFHPIMTSECENENMNMRKQLLRVYKKRIKQLWIHLHTWWTWKSCWTQRALNNTKQDTLAYANRTLLKEWIHRWHLQLVLVYQALLGFPKNTHGECLHGWINKK